MDLLVACSLVSSSSYLLWEKIKKYCFEHQHLKFHFHYQERSDITENKLIDAFNNNCCSFVSYKEEFFEFTNNIITKRVYDFVNICGKEHPTNDKVVIKEILEEGFIKGLTKLKKTSDGKTNSHNDQTITVTFRVLGFEIKRGNSLTSTIDVVLINGRQYLTVCCEKYSRPLMASDWSFLQKDGLEPCKLKFLQFCSHFHGKEEKIVNQKFRPSLNLIKTLFKQVTEPLNYKQMEAIVLLCQQVPCDKDTFKGMIEELQQWKSEITDNVMENLFVSMKNEKWQQDDSLIDTFLGWAFYPLDQILKPMLNFELPCLNNSPDIYRHLISATFGNQLSQAKILQMLTMIDDSEANQWNELPLFPPIALEVKDINKYPDILLFAHHYQWLEKTESIKDVRCWCNVSPEYTTNCPIEAKSYENILFSEEWRASCVYNKMMGMDEENEECKELLEKLNMGLYLHFEMESAKTSTEKLKRSKQSVVHGIAEDFYIIEAFEKDERDLWKWRKDVWDNTTNQH